MWPMEECGERILVNIGMEMAERCVKFLFYGMRNLVLEEVSETAIAYLNKKEI